MTRPTEAQADIVERLEALRAQATPGPYRAHDHNNMADVGANPDDWIGYAWVGRITRNSGPDGSFDAGWASMDRRKDACKEYRERASADAHFIAGTLNALPDLLAEITRLRAQLAEAELRGVKVGLEAGARVAERRAEDRFAEYAVTEPDTNARYYDGSRAEALEELDEEAWAITDAIRAIDPTTLTAGEGGK